MQPVQDILNRIRWDENWKGDEFKIGYYDRIEHRLIVVAFNEIRFPKGDHFTFEVIDRDGELHSVPFHRVKAIFRNGDLIWHREH